MIVLTYLRYIIKNMVRFIKKVYVYILTIVVLIIIFDLSGIFRHYYERDYEEDFSYPLQHHEFLRFVHEYRKGWRNITYGKAHILPVNTQYSDLSYNELANEGCPGPFRLIILVKSAPSNFVKREAIRSTWGNQRRFTDVKIKTVFLLGIPKEEDKDKTINYNGKEYKLTEGLAEEIKDHQDMVSASFQDSYYNNTYKLMSGMRWVVEQCADFQFAFFVDDDMYVSVKNLLKFVRNPVGYPDYWEQGILNEHERQEKLKKTNTSKYPLIHSSIRSDSKSKYQIPKNSPYDYDIDLSPQAKLYAGFVFFVAPHRHKIFTKWFLTLEEYPFNYFPPYVPAGAIILSREALFEIYYSSFFNKHFRFDDVYVAICAKKMGIEPFHSDYVKFWFDPQLLTDPYGQDHEYLIASHGFDDPKDIIKFWTIQKSLGRA